MVGCAGRFLQYVCELWVDQLYVDIPIDSQQMILIKIFRYWYISGLLPDPPVKINGFKHDCLDPVSRDVYDVHRGMLQTLFSTFFFGSEQAVLIFNCRAPSSEN